MYIYIEGKEPVARKSKSLAEMGVKDGDNLIVTTEMKLPFDVYSDDENDYPGESAGMFPPPIPGEFPGYDQMPSSGHTNPQGQMNLMNMNP